MLHKWIQSAALYFTLNLVSMLHFSFSLSLAPFLPLSDCSLCVAAMLWSFFPMLGKTHSQLRGMKKVAPPLPLLSSSNLASLPRLLFVFLPSSFLVLYVPFIPLFPNYLSSLLYSCCLSHFLSEDLSHFWLMRPQVSSCCCQQSQHAPGLWNTQQWASKVLFRSLSWLLWLGKSQRVGFYDTDR